MTSSFRRYVAVAAVAALAGVFFLTPVGAHVSDSVNHLWGDHIKAKGDKRYVRRYFAVIESDGDLVRGKGVLDAGDVGEGAYGVAFNRNVRNCAYVATLGIPGFKAEPPPGEIGVAGWAKDPKGVYVQTTDSSGAVADRPFHLAVLC